MIHSNNAMYQTSLYIFLKLIHLTKKKYIDKKGYGIENLYLSKLYMISLSFRMNNCTL